MWIFSRKKSIEEANLLEGAVDRHSHILYGVDDGIATLEDSLRCIEYYENHGLSDLWLTPHVMEDVPNSTERLKARFAEVEQAYKAVEDSDHLKVKLHLAAEYMLDNEFENRLDARDLLTMEDNMVLVETSTWAGPVDLINTLSRIMSAGYRPLLAHPERYHYMKPEDYDKIHEMGVYMQLNLASVIGGYGENAQKRAKSLIEKGYYSYFGSDCHRYRNIESNYGRKMFKKKTLETLSYLLHSNNR